MGTRCAQSINDIAWPHAPYTGKLPQLRESNVIIRGARGMDGALPASSEGGSGPVIAEPTAWATVLLSKDWPRC
jgi:hypothetical protein